MWICIILLSLSPHEEKLRKMQAGVNSQRQRVTSKQAALDMKRDALRAKDAEVNPEGWSGIRKIVGLVGVYIFLTHRLSYVQYGNDLL